MQKRKSKFRLASEIWFYWGCPVLVNITKLPIPDLHWALAERELLLFCYIAVTVQTLISTKSFYSSGYSSTKKHHIRKCVNDVNLLKNPVTIIRTKRIIFVLLNQKMLI